jgi:hypothetical protein
MKNIMDNSCTTQGQLMDNSDIDDEIESKIKACQMENGRCMTSTSNKLREKYGYDHVNRVLERLNKRRYRGNKYQEKGINQIMNILENLTKTNDRMTTQSSFEL